MTTRKKGEDLWQSEERFRLMVESVVDYAIFMLDPEGFVASWNPGAERIKGYRAEEIVGRHFSTFYPDESRAIGWPEYELAEAQRLGRFEDEGWRLRKDGTRFWANIVITALRDATGELRGFAKVTRDLTERRRAEALEEAGRQMNEFLAMLGHELRNPLAPIRNAVALLATHAQQHGPPHAAVEWARAVIERQLDHLTRLVDELLDIGRITSGKIALRRERLDLRDPVARAIEAARPGLDARGHLFEADLPDQPVWVDGDAVRLAQAVMNLLNNAAKYTVEKGRVWLRVTAEGDLAVVRVTDTGIGLSPELLPRVFDLFTQGEQGLDRSDGGLGIGLTLVRRLVESHGGTVSAKSAGPGQGSEFSLRLPRAESGPAGAQEVRHGPSDAGPAGRRRVLVIDDNEDSAATMSMLLEVWGHEVRAAHDGPAGLAMAAEGWADLVLMDIGLPGLTGYEVARRLRQALGESAPVLVAMTGYGQDTDRRRTEAAGFRAHLVKPVEPDLLKALVRDLPRRG